jgi:hypothetical protein
MVGVKGKSGRHKHDCSCERCTAKKAKKEEPSQEIAESDSCV